MNDFEQVRKFKQLQLEMLTTTMTTSDDDVVIENNSAATCGSAGSVDTKQARLMMRQKRKCKLWLELGSLYLRGDEKSVDEKSDAKNRQQAAKYFELVLDQALKDKDLLLESLAVGNLGLCKQNEGNYMKAIELFKV